MPKISSRGLRKFCIAARYESFRTASDMLFSSIRISVQPFFASEYFVSRLREFSPFPIIVHETLPKAWSDWSKASGIQLPENPKITRLDSMIAVFRGAQRVFGAALIPVPMGNLWFKEGSIVKLFTKELKAELSYYLVWTDDRVFDESGGLMRDWILRTFVTPA